jgi:hypothetical protein
LEPFGCALAVSLAVAMTGGEVPPGDKPVETVMQDDAQLLHGPVERVRGAVREMRLLGVDRVRLTAGWSVLAPGSNDVTRPSFHAGDSRDYPQGGFVHLDRAVKEVTRAGMKPMIDLAFFAPRWTARRGDPGGNHRWHPSAEDFGQFAEAVARRYDGSFRDPREGDGKLPAVRLWTTWNEPNHAGFLLPQWSKRRKHRKRRPVSPHIYRRMHEEGFAALKKVDRSNEVLIGGLSSFGGTSRRFDQNVPPLRFVRELACVNTRMRPLRRRECRDFRPLRADGFAHHPYSLLQAPDIPSPAAEDVRLADLQRLTGLLAELHRRGRIADKLPLYLTEYGYETNPPDPAGVAPLQQAEFMSQANYLAWRRPEVGMFAQFLLQDLGPNPRHPDGSPGRWSDYQTGLFDHDGKPKPALQAFRLPFWIEPTVAEDGTQGLFAFGQVRPGRGQQQVHLQVRDGDGNWHAAPSVPAMGPAPDGACHAFATDQHGFYERFFPLTEHPNARTMRAVWAAPDGSLVFSLPGTVPPGRPVAPVSALVRPR